MEPKETGAPAFPSYSDQFGPAQGMTLRDYFAAKIMAAYISRPDADLVDWEDHASSSYAAADAMLAVRT